MMDKKKEGSYAYPLKVLDPLWAVTKGPCSHCKHLTDRYGARDCEKERHGEKCPHA